jgi:MFS family permease
MSVVTAQLRTNLQERNLLPTASVLGAFIVFGFLFGVWQVLLTDLSASLGLSSGGLGFALTAGLTASIPAMMVGGRVGDRFGQRVIIVGAGLVMGSVFLGLAFVQSYAVLVALLVAFFAASGIYDVGINAGAMALEQANGRKVIPYMHAGFSGGCIIGALSAGFLVAAGVPFRLLYIAVTVSLFGIVGFVWKCLHAPPPASARAASSNEKKDRLGLYRNTALLLIAFITTLAYLSEGAVGNWSAIYLRRTLGLTVTLGASGVAVFHTAMVCGRVAAGELVKRLGSRTTLKLAGVAAALGMVIALSTGLSALILLGLLIVGLSVSMVAPVAFSVAGELAPDRAGEASSVITTIGYGGLLLGPSLIGGLAEVSGLRAALAVVIVAGMMIFFLSLYIPSHKLLGRSSPEGRS